MRWSNVDDVHSWFCDSFSQWMNGVQINATTFASELNCVRNIFGLLCVYVSVCDCVCFNKMNYDCLVKLSELKTLAHALTSLNMDPMSLSVQ